MTTTQIPRHQWNEYLAAFSARNQTRRIIVDSESSEFGEQRLIEEKPLLGIEPDIRDGEESGITVIAGDPEGGVPAALTHEIKRPGAIWVKEDEQGRAQALDIETPDGRTIIQFA